MCLIRADEPLVPVRSLVAWLTTVTVHYTVNALSAGKLALFIPPQMSSSPSFHIVLHKTTALKLCLLAFVCHVFGLFI